MLTNKPAVGEVVTYIRAGEKMSSPVSAVDELGGVVTLSDGTEMDLYDDEGQLTTWQVQAQASGNGAAGKPSRIP